MSGPEPKFGIAVPSALTQNLLAIMPLPTAAFFRICFVGVALAVASAQAAEKHPLLGATREQVLSRYGEPRSQMVAGNREVWLFARERLVLREGVVVEVERFAAEPARRAAEPGPAAVSPAPAPAGQSQAAPVQVPLAPAPAPNVPQPNPETLGPEPAPPAPTPAPAAGAAAPESRLEIKRILPPSAGTGRAPAPAPAAPTAEVVTAPVAPPAGAAARPASIPSAAVPASLGLPVAGPAPADPAADAVANAVAVVETEEAPKAAPAGEKTAPKKAKISSAARRRLETADTEVDAAEAILTPQTYVIAFLVIGGGLGYLVWRRRQRQLELAATTVSHTPFAPEATGEAGAVFTAGLVAKLEWKRFEELVASYYLKTGVVAVRTKAGPNDPVNIKISWKGESRPFALVRCLAQPAGLIDAKPLQELFAVLATEDIRRGYIVTTGKFNIPARDFAEEKHITLLPGDIFIEKLNALPDAARTELMNETTAGDYATPSCPKCDAKMAKTMDDPPVWRCALHADQTLPVRK